MKAVLPCLGIALLSACASAPPPVAVPEAQPPAAIIEVPWLALPYDSKTEYALAARKHWDAAHCMTRNAGRIDRSYIAISRPMLPRVVERKPAEPEVHEIVVIAYGTWGEKPNAAAQDIGLGMSARAIAVAQVVSRGEKTYASVWTAPHIEADFVRKFVEGC